MLTPVVKVIGYTRFLGVPEDLLPSNRSIVGEKGQDRGSELARLVECAGRTCYDSYGAGRPSDQYHQHIREVGHGSVLAHAVINFYIDNVSRGTCYSPDTLVLTRRGWLYFTEVTHDDEFATMDDSGNLLFIPGRIVRYNYTGHLLSFKSSEVDLLVTPNHNMWVYDYDKRSKDTRIWKFLRADQLTNRRYGLFRSVKNVVEHVVNMTLPGGTYTRSNGATLTYKQFTGDAELLAELVGWIVTDGHWSSTGKSGSGKRISITQTKPRGIERIKCILDILKIPYRVNKSGSGVRINISCLALWFFLVRESANPGHKSFVVRVPRSMQTQGQKVAGAFLRGVVGGNGTVTSGYTVVYTASKSFANDLVETAFIAGRAGSVRVVKPRTRYFKNGHISNCVENYVVNVDKEPLHLLNRSSASSFGEATPYTGEVICAELPRFHRLYVMRNGKPVWCGNTHELVRHSVGTAISQRSTRYVDESESPYAPHPIIARYVTSDTTADRLAREAIGSAQEAYREIVRVVQDGLVRDGVDRFTARKQARGAARGYLGNGLVTSLVWSANLRALRNVIAQRATDAADGEIRVLANRLYEEASKVCPEYFDDFVKGEAADRIGYTLATQYPKI